MDICNTCDEEYISPVKPKKDNDWFVTRKFNNQHHDIIVILTTRGSIMARYNRDKVRTGEKIKGARRYRTKNMADRKAEKLNKRFKTNSYDSVQEGKI